MPSKILLLAVGAVLAFVVPNAAARVQALPGNITAEATGPGGAVVTYVADGLSCDPPSGSTFHLGVTTVNCVDANNASAGSFTVTVVDTTAPVVTPPANVSVNTGNPAGTAVTYSGGSATDAVSGSITPSCSPSSGSNFGVGTTSVACTATDGSGNTGTATFTVTVNLVDTTPPTVNVPGPITAAATGPSGASVAFTVTASDVVDPSPTVSCNPASGSTFPLGTTTVSCTATDHSNNTSAPATFTVTVADQGAPTVTVPGPITREATGAGGAVVTFSVSAADAIDPSPTFSCNHASGDTFPLGTTTVSCTATDHSNNISAPASFTIRVTDTTSPTVSAPAPITAAATGPGGAAVTFSASATDLVDPSPAVVCSPASGFTFPLGTTTVSCTARDASGNVSAPATFTVTIADRGAPTVVVPGPITKEAAGPSGSPVTFTVTATDAIDPSPTVSCSKTSGATFPVGTTQVSCTAKDAANNTSAPATFNVNIVDTTAPQFANVPANLTAEANGPSGSKVNFAPPTAIDAVDGPVPIVACNPLSGSTFALGTNTVTCSASDSRSNKGAVTFKVKVVDTTPPKLIPPGDTTGYASTPTGSYPGDSGPTVQFLNGAHASDIADPHPTVSTVHPDFFAVGTTTVTFVATDASGNTASGTARLTLLPKPAPGTNPPALPSPKDNKPPANVGSLAAKSGDGRATLTWTNPTDGDFDHVEITRSTTSGTDFKATGTVVYRGKATTFTDRGLKNGVEYRYVVATFDKLGNAAAGVPIVVVPKKNLLRTPADGARLTKIPKQFVWTRDPKAAYYNLQLYAGGTLLLQSGVAARQKILSVFPTKAAYKFKSPWKWQGRKYTMKKGVYTWYVWPGYGPREDVNYGPLMGSATFQVTPKKKSR